MYHQNRSFFIYLAKDGAEGGLTFEPSFEAVRVVCKVVSYLDRWSCHRAD